VCVCVCVNELAVGGLDIRSAVKLFPGGHLTQLLMGYTDLAKRTLEVSSSLWQQTSWLMLLLLIVTVGMCAAAIVSDATPVHPVSRSL
jgi:hypothetical protein